MKTSGKGFLFGAALILCTALFYSFGYISHDTQDNPWVVPAKYKKMENPLKGDEEAGTIGKSLYSKHCKSCHGTEGKGDGPKAKELDTPSGDFSSAAFQAQSDGELFYKTTEGRDDMPAFDKKIAEEDDRWLVIEYLRSLK
ncbi:MAG: c-type cytochrome [Cyclobacteriaceae bacterium]|nr:c-type cytochrome [Cyclobacteriaceae bacterium]